MYFNLNSECYFVQGVSQGVIYNLRSGDIVELQKNESACMLNVLNGKPCEDLAFFKELVDMGWGFFSKERCFIDKLRPYSKMILSRADLRPPVPEVAFLQLTNKCLRSNKECAKKFCTPCRSTDCNDMPLKLDTWIEIIDKLHLAGVNYMILTGGDITLFNDLQSIIDHFKQKAITFSLVVNPFCEHMEKIEINTPLLVYTCGIEDANFFVHKFGAYKQVNIIYDSQINGENENIFNKSQFSINCTSAEVNINKNSVSTCNQDLFFKRKDFNSCLKGKIFINAQGNAIPCLQRCDINIGNFLKEEFHLVYKNLIEEYWNKSHIQVKCNACEWYYSCSSCMFVDPQKNCRYNLEQAKWEL